ncbi:MAG: hypothetical protein BWY06_03354 [Candidatus Latescibacteria bacterium ADurb.Bin168]|nr:MAG: hypothetical protein BWY06_03354 [Candidatus Latescibacteria bacterium ADurb.Bin168]
MRSGRERGLALDQLELVPVLVCYGVGVRAGVEADEIHGPVVCDLDRDFRVRPALPVDPAKSTHGVKRRADRLVRVLRVVVLDDQVEEVLLREGKDADDLSVRAIAVEVNIDAINRFERGLERGHGLGIAFLMDPLPIDQIRH